eukprot:UN0120
MLKFSRFTCFTSCYFQWKVDRVLAIHSLSSTASQGTSNIPFPWLLLLGCNRQAQWMKDSASCWKIIHFLTLGSSSSL